MTPDANKSIEIPLRSGELDWEPLSLKAACPKEAKTEDIEENWAICAGYGVLKNEMYRYCCGLIRGQSFLVAGHRGAGKTLLTHLAVQVNRWRAEGKISERPGNQTSALAVPILVSLHGPDLLNSTVDYAREKEGALATHSMEQILLGLQRAYKEEILLRFRSAFPGADSAADLAELTRELQSVSAGSSALRYWERFGVMSQGILGRTLGEASKLGQIANGSQGYAEVNLLESLNHCTETLEAGDNSTVQMATSGGSHVQIDLRRLRSYWRIIVPILSLVAAIFAVSKIPSGSTALASWLLPVAVFFFMIAATRRILFRDDQGFPETGLIDKRTLTSLDRALPVLVARMHQAGYAPIFVVDELDKVPEMATRLRGFMRQLKYFATDEAFFCFLTDRSYFETFEAELDRWRYPEEQTYFGHRVLVHYTPADTVKYLDHLFQSETGRTEASQESAAEARAESAAKIQAQLAMQYTAFASRCHPAEVKRFLAEGAPRGNAAALTIDEGSLWIAPGYRSSLYCHAVQKFLYGSSNVTHRLRQNHNFSAWILDALYYLPQMWLDTSAVTLNVRGLERFFAAQLNLTQVQLAGFELTGNQWPSRGDLETLLGADITCPTQILSRTDLDFLLGLIRRFANYLERPWAFCAELARSAGNHYTDIHATELVLSMLQRPLFRRGTGSEEPEGWEFDCFGTPQGKTPSEFQWKYFDAIRANDFQKTLNNCHPDAVEASDLLRELGARSYASLAAKDAWNREIGDVTTILWHHHLALQALVPSLEEGNLKSLVETNAITYCLRSKAGLFLSAALRNRTEMPDVRCVEALREEMRQTWQPVWNDQQGKLGETLDALMSGGALAVNLGALRELAKVRRSLSST